MGTGSVTIGHVAASFGADSSKSSKIISISSEQHPSIASSLNSITGVNANVLNKGDGTYSLVIRSATGASNAYNLQFQKLQVIVVYQHLIQQVIMLIIKLQLQPTVF